MGLLDVVWHLLGLFLPALSTGAIVAAGAKWLWRRELKHIPWWRLAAWPSATGSAALWAGLVILGRDGRMLSYLAMVAACALGLWWAGFTPARR
jgi:hypothetical protein